MKPDTLPQPVLIGDASPSSGPDLFPGARWFTAASLGSGLEYAVEPGALLQAGYLTADLLLEGDELAVFVVQFAECDGGPVMGFSFGLLNRCQARLRLPLESTSLNRWMYPREGALLKPLVWGERVDLSRVDRLRLVLHRTSGRPVRWCMTDLAAAAGAPPLLDKPLLTGGPLLDALGQSAQREWPTKTQGEAELVARLEEQRAQASSYRWPSGFSRWGGWMGRTYQSTGYFRTAQEEGRWWLVDPDGHLFWSTGLDCVGMNIDSACSGLESTLEWLPPADSPYSPAHHAGHWGQRSFNYLEANFIRAFGERWHAGWEAITLGLLRDWGFNTVANWSDWRIAQRAGFPYVRPLREDFERSALIYRSFPDVFHPDFAADAADYAQQLLETASDPALIGYFLMNEPTWGFSSETVAEGMLYTTPRCESRRALAGWLRERYGSDLALSTAWEMETGFSQVAEGQWTARLNGAARQDLADFSTVMVEKYFSMLNAACHAVDPNHLNLGARYYTVPPDWVAKGMRGFDVFSINCYRDEVPAEDLKRIYELLGLPTLVGEWHFGAMDAGLPASGIGCVRDQAARGQAYRVYVEQAAAIPWCVGVHYFTLYDQSALGRFDGENYNIGFLDTCNRPYEPLVDAARAAHERLYAVASGQAEPYSDRPEYLPRLFL